MTGVIVIVAIQAVMASVIATVANLVIMRKFPGHDPRRDLYLPLDRAYEVVSYRLISRIFHIEAIVLWVACLLLVLFKLVVG